MKKYYPISYVGLNITLNEGNKRIEIPVSVKFMSIKSRINPMGCTLNMDLGCHNAIENLQKVYKKKLEEEENPYKILSKPRIPLGDDITVVSIEKYGTKDPSTEYLRVSISITDTLYYDLGADALQQVTKYSEEYKNTKQMMVLSFIGQLLKEIENYEKIQ